MGVWHTRDLFNRDPLLSLSPDLSIPLQNNAMRQCLWNWAFSGCCRWHWTVLLRRIVLCLRIERKTPKVSSFRLTAAGSIGPSLRSVDISEMLSGENGGKHDERSSAVMTGLAKSYWINKSCYCPIHLLKASCLFASSLVTQRDKWDRVNGT